MQNEEKTLIFEKYYNEYFEYIKRYVFYKLNDYPDYAEDCVQETFRVLYEKLSQDIEFKYVKAFLIKTANNFVQQKYREITNEKSRNVSFETFDQEIPIYQNYFEVDEETILNLKDEIIRSLSKEEKELLIKTCKNYKDYYKTTRELSAEYSCSETNIRQKIFVLRRKIRRLIKEKAKNI